MKYFSLILLAAMVAFSSCKKLANSDVAPGNNDPNYDAHNRVFRVKASSTSTFKLVIVEYGDDGVTPYNTENADQTTPFDYGFTPVVGHKITVNIQSAGGVITASALYKGQYLDPIVTNTSGSGSTASFSYTVKD
ncbi:hypothetical protein [Mucilaginibacter celer]|uniref:Type 1 periplasmic binding fold superfamily protein n=1 Tax=Mucilaginibacter celer TaxID=2305508 RepID=A0A494VR16_9SPHI|nr:hypothetical protein [Mucilaginibacter celer]AYL95790.1 hypothetical protein HYN43_011040 [Mucilaginibacter celer]